MCDLGMHEKVDSLELKVDALHRRFDEHIKEESVERRELFKAIDDNSTAIREVAESVKGVVEIHRDLQGVARTGKTVQNFAIWLAKWGAIGSGLALMLNWFLEHLPKH